MATHRFLDPRLQLFRILKEIPHSAVRSEFSRKYYGRLRMYTNVDMDFIIAELPNNFVAVDLGTNRGLFTEEIIEHAAEIHAVEPDPLVFELLQKKFASEEKVKLYRSAIGIQDSEITFYRQTDFDEEDPIKNSVSSSVFATHERVNAAQGFTVPQRDIVGFLASIGKHIDLMKMDIEGAEVPVLEKLLESELLENISVMLVETHEHSIPDLVDRTVALRRRTKHLEKPKIDMNWH